MTALVNLMYRAQLILGLEFNLAGYTTIYILPISYILPPVPLPLKIEVQVEGVPIKDAFEALLVAVLPLSIQNSEGQIL